jgi:hypothetical protein
VRRLEHFLADRQLPPEHDPGAAGLGGSEGPAAWLKAAEHFGRCPLPVWITIQCINASSRSQPRTARRRPTPATGPGTRSHGTSRRATPTPGRIVSGFSSPSPLNTASEAAAMRTSRRRTCAELYRAVGPERVSCAAAPALLAVSGPVADCGVPCRLLPSVLTATAAAFCVDRVFPATASGKGACLRLRRSRRVSRLWPLVTVGLSPNRANTASVSVVRHAWVPRAEQVKHRA